MPVPGKAIPYPLSHDPYRPLFVNRDRLGAVRGVRIDLTVGNRPANRLSAASAAAVRCALRDLTSTFSVAGSWRPANASLDCAWADSPEAALKRVRIPLSDPSVA